MRLTASTQRCGAVVVESAIVLPIALVVLWAIVGGALAIFTYQQVAALAREASRYASVRGYQYSQSTGQPMTTPADVYTNCISPRLVNIDPSQLTYDVSWSPDKQQGSYVTVTLTYRMSMPVYGDMTFSSSATSQVTW